MKQIIEENSNIWCRGDLLEKRNKFSIKYQENDDFSATDESTAPIITDIGCECKTSRTDIIDRKTNHTYPSEGNTLLSPGSRDCSPQPSDDSDRLKRKIHKCHLCDFRTYQQESSLQRHIDIVHLKINDRICPFCDFHASNKWCLREHMHSVHLKLKNFKCHICYFSTSHKRFLQRHINSFHLRSEDRAGFKEVKLNHNRIKSAHFNVEEYKCPKCEFAVSKKRTLENHSHAVNTNSKMHELTKCDFQNRIQNHINYGYEERKTYQCYSCDYSVSEKRILRRHIISVHLKLKNHKCQRCDFRSSSKSNLQKHVNAVHFKQKNHECQFCNFRAFLKTSVQEHENAVHFKVMNHKCHLCKYVTSRRGGLLKHIYAIHSSVQKQKNYLCDYKFFTT